MKNILLINRTLSSGGAEKVMANLSIELNKSYKVYIALFDGSKIDYDYSGTILDLKTSLGKSLFSKIIGNITRIRKLRKIKAKLNITHSISFLDTPNVVNVLSRKNEHVITSIRNYKHTKSKIKYQVFNYVYKKSDKVVTVSHLIKQNTLKQYKLEDNKVVTIYNPYDLEKIRNLAGTPQRKKNQLVHVGSFTHQKNHTNLLKTVIEVKKRVPDIRLLLLGDGPLKNEIESFIEKNELEENVKLIGFVKNPYKYIAESELFVFPSLFEGFPNALVEAMVCGVPVIASDCNSGPREILAPSTKINYKTTSEEFADYGVLLPIPIDTKSIIVWAKTITKVLEDKSIYNCYLKVSKDRVKEFEVNHIINAWIELIS